MKPISSKIPPAPLKTKEELIATGPHATWESPRLKPNERTKYVPPSFMKQLSYDGDRTLTPGPAGSEFSCDSAVESSMEMGAHAGNVNGIVNTGAGNVNALAGNANANANANPTPISTSIIAFKNENPIVYKQFPNNALVFMTPPPTTTDAYTDYENSLFEETARNFFLFNSNQINNIQRLASEQVEFMRMFEMIRLFRQKIDNGNGIVSAQDVNGLLNWFEGKILNLQNYL